MGDYIREVRNWNTHQGYHWEIDWRAIWETVKFIVGMTLVTVWAISGAFAIVGIALMMLTPERTIFRYVLISFLVYVCMNKCGELEIACTPTDEGHEVDQYFLAFTAVSYLVIFFFAALTSLVLVAKALCLSVS